MHINSRLQPKTPYAFSKLKAERFLLSQAGNGPVISIIRLPLVYGKCTGQYHVNPLIKTTRIIPFAGFQNKRSIINVEAVCIYFVKCVKIFSYIQLHLLSDEKFVDTTNY